MSVRRVVINIGAMFGVSLASVGCAAHVLPIGGTTTDAPASVVTKPPCVGSVITVDRDEETPCDLRPPQRLDVTNVTIAECVDMGGEPIRVFIQGPTTCEGVDY